VPDFDSDAAIAQGRAVQDALLREDLNALRHLLSRSDAVVELVEARTSVQLLGCQGEPIANFPIDEEILASLVS
jgi:hypothetical protein